MKFNNDKMLTLSCTQEMHQWNRSIQSSQNYNHLNVLHLHLIQLVLVLRGVAIDEILPQRVCSSSSSSSSVEPVLVRRGRQCAVGDLGVLALIGQVTEPLLLEGRDNEKVIAVSFLLERMLCNKMYLLVFILICAVRSGGVRFISPLLNHLLHHFQFTRMWRGPSLKALKQKRKD